MKRVAMLVSLVLLAHSALRAQPLVAFAEDAVPLNVLHDPGSGKWWAPSGDWSRYVAWLKSDRKFADLGVAYLDSGIMADHPFIAPVLAKAIDLTGEGPQDDIGHGTVVALIGVLSSQAAVAPIISIKVFGKRSVENGAGMLEAGLKRALDEGVFVANVSAGVYLDCVNARDPNGSPFLLQCEDTPICKLIAGKPMLVVAAVGNTPNKTACPACCKSALAVGAADESGRPTSYSGAFPDILAPGRVRFGSLRGAD